MVAQDVVDGMPASLQRFIGFEQKNLWRPERFRNPASDSEIARLYLPECGELFRLPCFQISREHFYVCEDRDDVWSGLAISAGSTPRSQVLFPVHPCELRRHAEFLTRVRASDAEEEGVRLWATPTSSVRTLLVWPEGRPQQAFFTKLSLQAEFSGDRRLSRRKVASSVGLSRFARVCSRQLPRGIHCFGEPLGLTPRRMQDCGILFRGVPNEVKVGGLTLAPLFALCGGNLTHKPLALKLIENDRVRAFEILEEVLLARFAELWTDLVFDHGLILEAHGQDLLLALSPELVPLAQFYYRDFEGLAVDWVLRRRKGLAEPALPHTFDWFSTYETWGYPMYQLVSNKILVSLFDYLHLMLAELEQALRGWQKSGHVGGERIVEGGLTSLFSRYLRSAIKEKFGMREPAEYDIREHLPRFVKFLMQVRRAVLSRCA